MSHSLILDSGSIESMHSLGPWCPLWTGYDFGLLKGKAEPLRCVIFLIEHMDGSVILWPVE